MSNYRRANVAGACYFFTVVTRQRKSVFRSEMRVEILRDAFRDEIKRRHFVIEAAVVLPDHLHCLWRLPENDADFSSRWREIKKHVSKRLCGTANHRRENNIWQRRFWEHQIRDERDWRAHIDYIHYNPVKHGYVKSPSQWRYSSFRLWMDRGMYQPDWGNNMPGDVLDMDLE